MTHLLFSPEALRAADAVVVDVRPAPAAFLPGALHAPLCPSFVDRGEPAPAAFLPGALHAPLCPSFVDRGEPGRGRNPWKDSQEVRAFLASIGVTPEDPVVFYDDGGMGSAARAWYATLLAGFPKAALLDGGFALWTRLGFETVNAPSTRPAKTLAPLAEKPSGVFTFEKTLEIFRTGSHVLLDARPHDRWVGLVEPVDARPGRIPGSVSLPASRLLKDGRLRTPEEIRAIFTETLKGDDRPVLHYCGSGIAASLTIFAARLALVDASPSFSLYNSN